MLITGGTGSFGKAVLRRFLDSDISEITIFSRDEKKQDDMRKEFNHQKLKFCIGDVRDYQSILNATRAIDFIFHAAALKQVPSCEFFPMEAVKTNIIGTENLLEAAIVNEVNKVICLSTDKAVYPINAMGISKAMMEKVMVAKSRKADPKKTIICATRYGNVMGSRGSVIPHFINLIEQGLPISITDPGMTRFMMTLDDAVNLVLFAFKKGNNGDIFVQKAPAATIQVLVDSILELSGINSYPLENIGVRHGEKEYESLLSKEELLSSEDLGDYFKVPPDNRDLNYNKYFNQGNTDLKLTQDYNSHNTDRLDKNSMKKLLMNLDIVKNFISKRI